MTINCKIKRKSKRIAILLSMAMIITTVATPMWCYGGVEAEHYNQGLSHENDENITTVAADGTITGIAAGIITATDVFSGENYQCTVDCVDPVSSISIKAINHPYYINNEFGHERTRCSSNVGQEPIQLSATVLPVTANQNVEWETYDTQVVTVDDNGLVTIVGPGRALVYANSTDGTQECGVCLFVIGREVESIVADETSLEVFKGDKIDYVELGTITITYVDDQDESTTDQETQSIQSEWITGFDTDTFGNKTLTISYGGKTCEKTLKVLKSFDGCVKSRDIECDYDGKSHRPSFTFTGAAAEAGTVITYYWRNLADGSSAYNLTEIPQLTKPGLYYVGCTVSRDGYKNYGETARIFISPGPVKNISKKLIGYDDIQLTWDKATGANGYKIYRKLGDGSYSYYTTVYSTASKVSKNIYNLYDGKAYSFAIVPLIYFDSSMNIARTTKTYSGKIYTLKKLGTPVVYKASKNYVKVKWTNISGETGYQIARSKYKTRSYSIVKTASYRYSSATIKTTRNRTYYYKIRAYKTVNGKRIYGPWSSLRAYKLR